MQALDPADDGEALLTAAEVEEGLKAIESRGLIVARAWADARSFAKTLLRLERKQWIRPQGSSVLMGGNYMVPLRQSIEVGTKFLPAQLAKAAEDAFAGRPDFVALRTGGYSGAKRQRLILTIPELVAASGGAAKVVTRHVAILALKAKPEAYFAGHLPTLLAQHGIGLEFLGDLYMETWEQRMGHRPDFVPTAHLVIGREVAKRAKAALLEDLMGGVSLTVHYSWPPEGVAERPPGQLLSEEDMEPIEGGDTMHPSYNKSELERLQQNASTDTAPPKKEAIDQNAEPPCDERRRRLRPAHPRGGTPGVGAPGWGTSPTSESDPTWSYTSHIDCGPPTAVPPRLLPWGYQKWREWGAPQAAAPPTDPAATRATLSAAQPTQLATGAVGFGVGGALVGALVLSRNLRRRGRMTMTLRR